MKLALFNGFTFHYEMFGYIIHYCKTMNHELTIYCHLGNNYLTFFSSMYSLNCKDISTFHNDYDYIFLITDDDPYYHGDIHKTICIDHFYKIRSPQFNKRITTRPFDDREYVLPVYPITIEKKKISDIIILLIGHSYVYDISALNRLTSDKPITIKVISRYFDSNAFNGCKFPVIGYNNPSTFDMITIISESNYIMSNVALGKNYVHECMSGAVPLAFSTLTPLILSKETNTYYKFKNCIEYDESDIVLKEIDTNLLKAERDEMIKRNHSVLNELCLKR